MANFIETFNDLSAWSLNTFGGSIQAVSGQMELNHLLVGGWDSQVASVTTDTFVYADAKEVTFKVTMPNTTSDFIIGISNGAGGLLADLVGIYFAGDSVINFWGAGTNLTTGQNYAAGAQYTLRMIGGQDLSNFYSVRISGGAFSDFNLGLNGLENMSGQTHRGACNCFDTGGAGNIIKVDNFGYSDPPFDFPLDDGGMSLGVKTRLIDPKIGTGVRRGRMKIG